jgi:hypothetical protein
MKVACISVLVFLAAALGHAQQRTKCEASINGQKIHTVYIMGDQYKGVAWAYKHIAEETCLIPTTDALKADAILEVRRQWVPQSTKQEIPATVSCTTTGGAIECTDSSGGEMTIDCPNNGPCDSMYGPGFYGAATGGFNEAISTRWDESDALIYTMDHKLLWSSETQKGDASGARWPDKVRLGTNSPVCKVSASDRPKYKSFRHWARTACGVEFDPYVSIDLKLIDRQKSTDGDQGKQAKSPRS